MEEQRSSVPEKAKQEREIPAQWAWVEPVVWTDKMLAALEWGVKGGKWFSLIDKVWYLPNLESAWKQVAANRGSAGIDNISIKHYRRHAAERLNRTSELLKQGLYQPHCATSLNQSLRENSVNIAMAFAPADHVKTPSEESMDY